MLLCVFYFPYWFSGSFLLSILFVFCSLSFCKLCFLRTPPTAFSANNHMIWGFGYNFTNSNFRKTLVLCSCCKHINCHRGEIQGSFEIQVLIEIIVGESTLNSPYKRCPLSRPSHRQEESWGKRGPKPPRWFAGSRPWKPRVIKSDYYYYYYY